MVRKRTKLPALRYAFREDFSFDSCPNMSIFTLRFNAIIKGTSAIYWAIAVPAAAPEAPNLKVKINNGFGDVST